MATTALIAEDEPLLAAHLRQLLQAAWPQLRLADVATDGAAAVRQALSGKPDIVFLDIRMPAMSGLEAAARIAEDWPPSMPLPLMVFVTAYDQYAVAAFERAAVDYLLKPVQPERLAATVRRLQEHLDARGPLPAAALTAGLSDLLARMNEFAGPGAGPPTTGMPGRLHTLQASVGPTIYMVPVDQVLFFEAADKYIRVLTLQREYLIRMSIRELLEKLDPQLFWQIHRGVIVRVAAISAAHRDPEGRIELTLEGSAHRLGVSRLYAHRFKAM